MRAPWWDESFSPSFRHPSTAVKGVESLAINFQIWSESSYSSSTAWRCVCVCVFVALFRGPCCQKDMSRMCLQAPVTGLYQAPIITCLQCFHRSRGFSLRGIAFHHVSRLSLTDWTLSVYVIERKMLPISNIIYIYSIYISSFMHKTQYVLKNLLKALI